MTWLSWELFFSMLCMMCMDKGSSLNLDLMIYDNYVMIMIMLMSISIYMDICMSFYDRIFMDHDCFMLMFICILYVCMSLSDRVIRNRS